MMLPEPTEFLVWAGLLYTIADALVSAWQATMHEPLPRRTLPTRATQVALRERECGRNSIAPS
jgi:hypothetical protein